MKTRIKNLKIEFQTQMFGEGFLVFVNTKRGKWFVQFADASDLLELISKDDLNKVKKNGIKTFSINPKRFKTVFKGSNL